MRLSVFIEISLTIFVPLYFRMFGDINCLRVFEPNILNINKKFINDVLKDFNTLDG